MATLTGSKIANSYKQLLQVGSSNSGLTGTVQTVQDGSGTNSGLQLSNSSVNIDGTFQLNGVTLTANASTLNNVADLTGATGLVAVSGGSVYGRTLTAGSGITIGNADGTEGNPTIAVSLEDTTINVAKVSASVATFNSIVSAGFFVGDGSGLTNVPSAEGGTVKRIEAGTGIKITVDGGVSSSIPVSGTILVSADQNFGTVSVSTALAVTGSLLISGVNAATINDVAAVSVLTKTNLDAITSINTVVANVSALTSVNTAAITSINSIIGDGGNYATSAELATVSAALATSIGNSNTNIAAVSALTSVNTAAVTSINTVVAAVSVLTKTNLDAITSINTVVADVSALTSVNSAAVTSINTVVANLSSTFATSINNRTAAITSVNTVITNLSATMATSIANHLPLAGGTMTGILTVNPGGSRTGSGQTENIIITNSNATGDDTGIHMTAGNTGKSTIRFGAPGDDTLAQIFAQNDTTTATLKLAAGNSNTNLVLSGPSGSETAEFTGEVGIGIAAPLKQLHITKAAVADIVSLTDAANIAVDFNTGQNFALTLTDNRTLDNPTNCVPGQVGSIFIVQDGTGSRTLAYGSSWDFAGGTAPVLSTDAAAVDRLDYIVQTSTDVQALVTKAYS